MKNKYNIIFLDIDGVLNSPSSMYFRYLYQNQEYYKNLSKKTGMNISDLYMFCPTNVANLLKILQEIPNLKIVISSSHRKYHSLSFFKDLFKAYNLIGIHNCLDCNGENKNCKKCKGKGIIKIKNNIIGKTKDLKTNRGREIKNWIENSNYNINKFLILDDDSDMSPLMRNLYKTNGNVGLTIHDTINIINYFKK